MEKKYLFTLQEDEPRAVFLLAQSGILQIESQLNQNDYRSYNRFVDGYEKQKSFWDTLRNAYHKAQANLYKKNRSIPQTLASFFLPYVPMIEAKGTFLDIGCNTGSLLEKLPSAWVKYGVEINSVAYARAKETKNTCIYNGTLEDFEPSVKFDFVRASHVIEHVPDYLKFAEKMFVVMSPGAHALLYTPNTRSLSFFLFKKYWSQFYDKTHVHLFNLTNIKEVLKHRGFEIVEEGTYYMGTTASSFVKALGLNPDSIAGKSLFFSLSILFFPLSFLVNLFNLGGALYIYIKK